MKTRNRILPALLIHALCLIFATTCFSETIRLTPEEREYLQRKGTIVFVSQTRYPPFEFVDERGQHEGMMLDVVRWLAVEMGFQPVFTDMTFKEAQEAVLSGKVDVLTSLFYSDKRAEKFAFTRTLFDVPASIFVHSSRTDIKSLADLNGKIIAMQKGDYAKEFLESQKIKFELLDTADFGEATNMVIAGKADALIGDEQIVLYHIFSNRLTAHIKKVGEPLYTGKDCMAARKDLAYLIGILNKGIREAEKRGVLEKVSRKWLGTRYGMDESVLYRYARPISAVAALVLLLAFAVWLWNIRLRSMVRERTTDLRKAVESLQESESALRGILSASPVGIALVENRIIRWVNESWGRMFGHADELVGQSTRIIYPGEDEYDRVGKEVYGALEAGETVETEGRFRRGDGSPFHGYLRVRSLDLSEPQTRVICVLSDISDRKRAEEALRESQEEYRSLYEQSKRREELYRSLLDSSPDAVVVYDLDGNAQYVNYSFTRMFGWTIDEVKDRRIPYLPDSEAEAGMALIRRVLSDGEPYRGFETKRYTKDGRVLDVSISGSRYHDHKGNPAGLLVILTDITEQKRLEQQLRQAQKMEAIGQLAGGVAHDFNNLLTAMIGYSKMLLQQMEPEDPNRKRVLQINRAAEQAAGVTRQLLAFGRKTMLDVSVLDLNELLEDIESMLRRLIGEDIELFTAFGSSLGLVKADPNQIEQIVVNLAVNARDAMLGGGKLTMETANAVLDQEYARRHPEVTPGDYVMLAVSDTGCGMDSHTLTRIFDPFFTTKGKGKGTGLGLSTVFGVVKQHQGHISVYSEPGCGSTFKIYLPRAQGPLQPQSRVHSQERATRQGTEIVLVVEDENMVRSLACEALEMFGYTVLTAASPEEALKVSDEYPGAIDLLVTDVVLPKMDGKSLSRSLSVKRPRMKVLYISGYAENAIVHHGVLDKGIHFLAKPFDLDSLVLKVREVLDE